VKRLVGEARLLTLTGPGGAGKTRLALAVAFEVVEGFEEGAWWVGLAPISDSDLVQQEVASAIGVREAPGRSLIEVLVERLKPEKRLLVLDNCEHLIGTCAELADTLLHACPNLKILATSREALGVAGERSWAVPSLSVPDPERLPPVEELGRYEAIRLFCDSLQSGSEVADLDGLVRELHRPPFSTLRRTDDEGEVRTFLRPGGSLRFLCLPNRRRTRGGWGRGIRRSGPRSFTGGPVVQSKVCVQAVLKALPYRQVPGSRKACSSATTAFEATLKGLGR
jgi:hypothetical protein